MDTVGRNPGGVVAHVSRLIAGLAALLLPCVGSAVEYCDTDPVSTFKWRATNSFMRSAPYNVDNMENSGVALEALRAGEDAFDTAREYVPGFDSAKTCSVYSSPLRRCTVNSKFCNNGSTTTGCVTKSLQVEEKPSTSCTPEPPPEPFDCAALANKMHLGQALDQPDSFVPADSICVKNGIVDTEGREISCSAWRMVRQGTNCVQPDGSTGACNDYKRMGPTGERDILVRYKFSGLECEDEPEQPETPIEPECETDITGSVSCQEDKSEKCHTANGLTWCEGLDNKKNCGFANNKYTCLDSLQPDKCMAMPDGSRLCVEGAPSPPVPDNGTPGVKAEPDSNMEVCTGEGACTQHNYYNGGTVSGSARDPGAGSGTDGSGVVGPGGVPGGTGTGDGEGEEEGEVGGGGTCAEPPTCSGDPIACATLQQQWKTRCSEVDQSAIESAFGLTEAEREGDLSGGGEGFTIGSLNADGGFSASCPTGTSITVKGYSIDFDIWDYACQMALLFAPVTMLLGYIGAARIIYKGLFK